MTFLDTKYDPKRGVFVYRSGNHYEVIPTGGGVGVTMGQVNAAIGNHDGSTTAHADIRTILQNLIGVPTWDGTNYILTFTAQNGSTLAVDLPLEALAKGLDYDADTKEIVLTKQDGSTIRIDVADLIDVYLGSTGTQIQISIGADNTINATLLAGTIDETFLNTALLAKINGKAEQSVVDGKMNIFTISAGSFVLPDWPFNAAEIYLVTALSPELLNYLENTEWAEFSFRCVEPFHAEFEHIGNEYITHEGYGWDYTDGFMVAYDDTTGEMTRWSPPGGNAYVDAVLDTSGFIKFTPKNPSDRITGVNENGLLLQKNTVDTTFDGVDVYNKGVADKAELIQLIAALQAQIDALTNP